MLFFLHLLKFPFKQKPSHFVVHFSPKDPSRDPTDVAAPCLAMPRAPRAPERPTRPEEPQEMEPGAVGRKRKATKVKQLWKFGGQWGVPRHDLCPKCFKICALSDPPAYLDPPRWKKRHNFWHHFTPDWRIQVWQVSWKWDPFVWGRGRAQSWSKIYGNFEDFSTFSH